MKISKILLSLGVVSLMGMSAVNVWAAPGDLDTSFGTEGTAQASVSITDDFLSDIAIQSDGKIVAVGSAENVADDFDIVVARFNKDGSLDTSFGVDGVQTTDLGGTLEIAQALGIQSDGKIIVVGSTDSVNASQKVSIVRYDTNGQLDTSFGASGILVSDFGFAAGVTAVDIDFLLDGSFVVGGSGRVSANEDQDFIILHFSSEGVLDPNFGSLVIDFGGNQEFMNDIDVQPDGKILMTGISFNNSLESISFSLARLLPDGIVDSDFGTNGQVLDSFVPDGGFFSGTAISGLALNDGNILVGGSLAFDFALAKYDDKGILDTEDPVFGPDGLFFTDLTPNLSFPFGKITKLIAQPDGKVLAAGVSSNPFLALETADVNVVRYNADGSVDTSFGTDGVATVVGGFNALNQFSGGSLSFLSGAGVGLALQPDGAVVVGSLIKENGKNNFRLTRLQGGAGANQNQNAGAGGGGCSLVR